MTFFEVVVIPIIMMVVIAGVSFYLGYMKCEQKWYDKTDRVMK